MYLIVFRANDLTLENQQHLTYAVIMEEYNIHCLKFSFVLQWINLCVFLHYICALCLNTSSKNSGVFICVILSACFSGQDDERMSFSLGVM